MKTLKTDHVIKYIINIIIHSFNLIFIEYMLIVIISEKSYYTNKMSSQNSRFRIFFNLK